MRTGLGSRPTLVDWPGHAALGAADMIISTVPAGATDQLATQSPAGVGQLLFDVLYDPWPTSFAVTSLAAGAEVIGGLELLVQQAARQVELWTGRVAPVAAMRAAGEAALAFAVGGLLRFKPHPPGAPMGYREDP